MTLTLSGLITRTHSRHGRDGRAGQSCCRGRRSNAGTPPRRRHVPRFPCHTSGPFQDLRSPRQPSMVFRLMEQRGPRAVPFRYVPGCDDRPSRVSADKSPRATPRPLTEWRCTMPVTPSPDEQRMTPGSQWTKAQRIPRFRRVETFLWRCLIDSSIAIVGHPYPPSDYWEAVLSGSIRAEARRGLREIERHLRAN
jgi:hypothetical protein